MKAWVVLGIGLVSMPMLSASADSLAQRVWQRYTRPNSVQVRAVSRFEELSLEAKPSAYENADPAKWKQVEQEVQRLVGQEVLTYVAVRRPNRLYIEQKSAFGWFRSVCDGKMWYLIRHDGTRQQVPAPTSFQRATDKRYRAYLVLEEGADSEVLHLLVAGAEELRQKLLRAKVQAGPKPNIKHLVWSEPIVYQGLTGRGTITCVVDASTALIQRVECRFDVGYGSEARLHIVIGQRWDNSQLSKPPSASLFRLAGERGANKR